ncbi:MAG: bifunctional adenosylcobinamide kinase/adenosylcobinamide-phosphate guanylyltransferase [Rhodoferax sp.]|jgi:adenosylcobinamide kinase/adenosylcobinamide-phosphate guanylyltransferase|nr:bifunctional adenosylcobinamide kinase/adenosylcobinamide-phosphate guanylyltransferase [Rhodoferax sp.]MBP9928986.1 bifunctional adenosylcobinamide kinase/adenosylcobinamide-phosphate guanylyltransferase [Rhodoferax sp.]HQX60046.1 bifunctional adenosylcobinamide kinase/adenosylcobinamide-phosphate guanylyltransferase [Burkholderiaceae bacterium]HQZ04259.1 bifunctional adenosylcobinamide kinase/adenosylcobinamide-phosphate guanylyltransferase [Burkholderiaceae bacterium]HRA61589.1 bifunction
MADSRGDLAHDLPPGHSELILGGQRSGKSRRAQALAAHWLAASPGHHAVLLATATASDAEMAERIRRHQRDRAGHCPDLRCVEVPLALPQAIAQHGKADTLVVVDCLTLWLTNLLWPRQDHGSAASSLSAMDRTQQAMAALESVIAQAPGPLVLVGNEIGQGVIPLGPQVRAFVDTLGQLNQAMARCCTRVTWMVAGLPVRVKGP